MDSRIRLQPLVDLNNKSILGYEALYSKKHSSEFPSASVILRRIASQYKCDQDFQLFINMTLEDAANKKFCNEFLKTMNDFKIDGRRIVLELNESTHPESMPQAKKSFDLLHTHGVKIALDDFGTQYSSMEYMKELPVDIIKMDKKFVQSAPYNRKSRSMLKFCIALAHDIGCKVVVEGIENSDHLNCARDAMADIGQGFLFLASPSFPTEVRLEPFIQLRDFILYQSRGFSLNTCGAASI
ncbi:MAG: EAL domain-containing protein [Holosporaceae bacterium]|jgi:EAL domain-containing protein (putative c-di-GMP-specific phosphodiesterase class I)|nr:EAL domain-containing protein [Holosporaceae bacterium]